MSNRTTPETVGRPSKEWARIKGITVVDPDGWDRKDFDNSWSESITEKEFDRRASLSTTFKSENR